MRSIQRRLIEMIDHVLLTLHTSSPALEVLRMANAEIEEYLAALKAVIGAVFFVSVLLNIVWSQESSSSLQPQQSIFFGFH